MTGEAAESICNQYSQKGTTVDFAEAYVLALENIPMHSWREREREEGEGQMGERRRRESSFCCCQVKADLECHLLYIHAGSLASLQVPFLTADLDFTPIS